MPSGKISKREFMHRGALCATASILPATFASGREYGHGQGMPWRAGVADPPHYGRGEGGFFTVEERQAVDAITARLIPTDETGPGAREADVVTFIDRQLAGFYGRAQRWYMEGPFPDEPLDTQGYQQPHTPAGLWREGLAGLDAHCREAYDDRPFHALSEEDQDAVLTAMADGEIEFEGLSAERFFDFAREMTIEGFFCDPIYGGNRDMAGWRLVGFPGARYDYRDFIHHDGAALDLPPVSLAGRPGWNPQER
jgi:gluconate 2-dehydrogenase gamma chain